jgi:hypothetical protein
MTRGEVARRLGKSIATVRRLEGRVLFPTKRRNGRWWFDESEVEALRCDPDRFRANAPSTWLRVRIQLAEPSKGAGLTSRRAALPVPVQRDAAVVEGAELVMQLLSELLNAVAELPPRQLVRAGIDEEFLDRCGEALGLLGPSEL